jgi:phthiocerol/phenolphthiocerol synthesis type-I polyketide synthase E
LQRTLGKLWLAGARIDWAAFYAAEKRRRLPLPGYAFERERYWVEPQRRNQKPGRSDFQLSVEPDASNGSHGAEELQITSEPIPTLHARPDLPAGYRLPSNEVERKLANIWERLLGIEPIGIDDSFFDLGGHSLLATQVTSRVRDAFNIELPVAALFEFSTIAEIAPVVMQGLLDRAEDEELAQMLAGIRDLSPSEVQFMLEAERVAVE